jgi:hypothetical protein
MRTPTLRENDWWLTATSLKVAKLETQVGTNSEACALPWAVALTVMHSTTTVIWCVPHLYD